MKLQKYMYFTYYNLLIVHNLWQAHYQILSIILLKNSQIKFKTDTMIENVKLLESNTSIASIFLNMQTLKMI